MAFLNDFKVMTNSVTKSATNLMNSVSTEVKEQENKARINRERGVIDTEIDAAYTQIGRKYVEYYIQNQESTGLDVFDLLKMLKPKLARKEELDAEFIEIEKRLKDVALLQEKNKLESEFTVEKEKFDRALAMDVITQEEYDQKIKQYRKRIELFDEIKNIEQQFDFGIITAEEKEIKINSLLND
ncbi:hypothetical protein AB4027_00165 [Alkalibacterium putridalgicola]|uniref:hypothetical protein n=1 Tax=Alkalibacterium putridalgicola TaxID=426703 RepID=UPI0034CEFACA